MKPIFDINDDNFKKINLKFSECIEAYINTGGEYNIEDVDIDQYDVILIDQYSKEFLGYYKNKFDRYDELIFDWNLYHDNIHDNFTFISYTDHPRVLKYQFDEFDDIVFEDDIIFSMCDMDIILSEIELLNK